MEHLHLRFRKINNRKRKEMEWTTDSILTKLYYFIFKI